MVLQFQINGALGSRKYHLLDLVGARNLVDLRDILE
jgi:hypothetical protein